MSVTPQGKRSEYEGPPRVVILGGGYGGVYAALGLKKAIRKGQISLSLISRDNFFLYQPMLAEVVSGSVEPPHIVNPIRRLLPSANFRQAEVEAVDAQNRDVIIRYPGTHAHYDRIPYDHLIIAVGSSTDLSNVPGMTEHAFPFRTLGDAFALRNHLISVIERAEVENNAEEKAELLTFVVVGGGYTGVEVAAEINSFVREAARDYPNVSPGDVRVVLLQGSGRILPELNENQAAFSHRVMEKRGIEIRLGSRIKDAAVQRAVLNDGQEIATRTIVAAIGSSPNRLLETVPGSRDSRGRLVVDETLSVPEHSGIWAVGDCAAVPDLLQGGTTPPTAQYALRQGRHVAKNILAGIKGGRPSPFSYKSRGVFVPLGRFSAAGDVMGFQISGFPAWWLYRTYYLYQLPRLERKLKVVIDWTLECIFRRDIVRLDSTGSQGVSRAHYDAGETVFREGGPTRNLYVVLEGRVGIISHGDGVEKQVAELGPGDFFGERSLLQGSRHSASARALTAVDLMVMSGADFTALTGASTQFDQLLKDVMRKRSGISEQAVVDGLSQEGSEGHEGQADPTSRQEGHDI